jgi:hypothetical protein
MKFPTRAGCARASGNVAVIVIRIRLYAERGAIRKKTSRWAAIVDRLRERPPYVVRSASQIDRILD